MSSSPAQMDTGGEESRWPLPALRHGMLAAGDAARTRGCTPSRSRHRGLSRLGCVMRRLPGPEGVGRDAVLFELGVERGARDVEQA